MSIETLTYVGAVNAALHRAMREFPDTLYFGEDVAKPGGVFGASRGLLKDFGARVFDTPISESAILGAAVGSSIEGKRPIAEIMWVDFSLVALDQLVNQAANVRYISNGLLQAPLTVRTQQGVLAGSCAQHSQSLEALFAHIPGLLVGTPATPQDAFGMLLSAIAANDPAIIIEHRSLYLGVSGDVDVDAPIEKPGGAVIRRAGTDVTIASWGAMLHAVLDAADTLSGQGIEAEVVDVRWMSPLDLATLEDSVKRTSRLVIAHEANLKGGFGAEIAAQMGSSVFEWLDAPILRIGVPNSRIPAAPVLQQALVPNAETIAADVSEFMQQ